MNLFHLQAIEKNLLRKKDGVVELSLEQSEQTPAKPRQPAARKPASVKKPQVRGNCHPPSLAS